MLIIMINTEMLVARNVELKQELDNINKDISEIQATMQQLQQALTNKIAEANGVIGKGNEIERLIKLIDKPLNTDNNE